jgi:small GTP-binding protein
MNTFKVVLLGDSGVGKTSLLKRYMFDMFESHESMTIGASFFQKTINHKYKEKEEEMTLQIWDTAGQERFRSMIPMYIRNAHIALIVFDSSENIDIKEYFKKWIGYIRENNGDNIIIYLIGTKRDLIKITDINREVLNHIDIDRKNIGFVSSKTGQFVNQLFDRILNDIIENNMIQNEIVEEKIDLTKSDSYNYKCC